MPLRIREEFESESVSSVAAEGSFLVRGQDRVSKEEHNSGKDLVYMSLFRWEENTRLPGMRRRSDYIIWLDFPSMLRHNMALWRTHRNIAVVNGPIAPWYIVQIQHSETGFSVSGR